MDYLSVEGKTRRDSSFCGLYPSDFNWYLLGNNLIEITTPRQGFQDSNPNKNWQSPPSGVLYTYHTPPSIDSGDITKPNQRGRPYLGSAGAKTSGQH